LRSSKQWRKYASIFVEHAVVERLVERDALQLAVGRVAPAVVGAGEERSVALLVAAHLHAAVAAGVQEDVDDALLVPAEDHRLLAHAGGEEVTGLGDQALVPYEQPGPGEELLQLLPEETIVHEDLPADQAAVGVDELIDGEVAAHLEFPFSRRSIPKGAGKGTP
jgi:hypothetical protein